MDDYNDNYDDDYDGDDDCDCSCGAMEICSLINHTIFWCRYRHL